MQAPAGGAPWVRTQGRKGDDGSHTASPPPPCRGTSAAPRACAVLATCLRQRTDSEGAPPPTPYSPTHPGKGRGQRGGGEGTWGGGRGQTDVRGGETGGEQWRRKKKKKTKNKANQRARGRKREDRDQNRDERGEAGATWARKGRRGRTRPRGYGGPKGETPPPTAASPCACVVLASCLRHACYKGKTTRATRGMTVAERGPPPPEDNAAGRGGSGERVRDRPHDRAQREHAPCKPQQGDHRGCDRTVGRATTGATRLAPPPICRGTSAEPRAYTVLATC